MEIPFAPSEKFTALKNKNKQKMVKKKLPWFKIIGLLIKLTNSRCLTIKLWSSGRNKNTIIKKIKLLIDALILFLSSRRPNTNIEEEIKKKN